MKKGLLLCALLVAAGMFSACGGGGDSSSSDEASIAPELHPENYPAVDDSAPAYLGTTGIIGQINGIYSDALDDATEVKVSDKVKLECGRILRMAGAKRASAGDDTVNLSYNGKGYTVTGSVVFTSPTEDEYPNSFLIDMKVVFSDYVIMVDKASATVNGTVVYKSKGTYTNENTLKNTEYTSGDYTMTIGVDTHSIKFDFVSVADIVNGTGTFNDKTVVTIDGTTYGDTSSGIAEIE